MINFKCSCGKELKVPDTLARKVVTCNQCGRKNIQLPGAGERLDLTDYELEDINEAGTIVLEPPSALSSIAPRKPVKNQPSRTPSSKNPPRPVSEARPRRVPRRNEKPEPEPEPEPQEEFENEPARPARNTRRLEEKKQEAPTPRSERPSRRANVKKTKRDDDEDINDKSSLKAKSSQVVIETLTKLVEELKEDEQETVGEVKAARKGRSGRGDRGSGRGSDSRGSKSKRSRSNDDDEDEFRDYGNSQKFLYVIIGAIVLIGIGLFFYFREPDTKKMDIVKTEPVVDPTKLPEKTAPKVEPPKYEKITEEGNRLLDLFEVKGENKDAITKALEEKRVSAVNRKMSSKSYDSYIQNILNQKLAYVFAINHILENVKFENEEHKFILYTVFSRIHSVSDLNGDRELMKGLQLNLNAPKIIWDKEKVVAFLETTKKDFDDPFQKIEIIKTPIDWKLIVEIVVSGKVEDDTTDIQLPQ